MSTRSSSLPPPPNPKQPQEAVFNILGQGMIAAASLYIGWRLASGCVSRLTASISGHRRRRRALLRKWQALSERIERLQQLSAAWRAEQQQGAPPPLQQQQQVQQQQQQQVQTPAQAPAPARTATVSRGGLPALQQQQQPAATSSRGQPAAARGAPVEGSAFESGVEVDSSLDADADVGAVEMTTLQQQQQQQQQHHPSQQRPWGSGLAGWSQLYAGRTGTPTAAAQQQQQQQGVPFPGGSPVLLTTPWDNNAASSDDEDWEEPQFAGQQGSSSR